MKSITQKLDRRVIVGALMIMLAALFWSLDGVFIRPKLYSLPANLVVFIEHFLGLIVLSPFIFINWQKIKNLSLKSWGALFWVSIFGGALGTIMITQAFFAAISGSITFATVVILQKLQPIFALILARIILKEKLTRQFYLWAILAIIAGYFLAFGKTGLDILQINFWHSAAFYAFVAAFAFGSSTVFGKRIVNHLDFGSTSALRFALTTIIMLAIVLIGNDFSSFHLIEKLQWELFAAIVFTSGAVAMFIYYFGLNKVTASTATICEMFWPFSAVILDYILNKNVLNSVQIISALVLLFAFYKVVTKGTVKNISFAAKVVKGVGRGRNLGFPTANLDKVDLDIEHGIYLVEVIVSGEKYKGLMHFGFRETFDNKPSLEVYIHKFSKNIYGQKIDVKVLQKIREVLKFKNAEELNKQIQKDLKFIN